ncbi:MAG: bifunctional folylpolyglutamate synthase/dihydrofolate synthase [Myxococcales bacterium]|nr:bifunctional folylpolyglutamate synthase/dihydrofolate synthase [Myxococcales bacterium]
MTFPIETSEAAGRYLETLINFERRPELMNERLSTSPIRALLDRLGKPEQGLAVIHVAGSKGKGSTCLFAEGALTAAGKRTGVFTSPHLHSWTERFRIAGREVDGAVLADAVTRLRPEVEWLREHEPLNSPTFFDATTAAALLIFAEAALDYVILEVGLGGRLDSTNVVMPRVTCITSIELEHTDKLGNSIAEIAAEKAGILKPGIPCLMGRLSPEAERVVRARALKIGAPLLKIGDDFPAADSHDLTVLGNHQLDNAGIALAALDLLGEPDREQFLAAGRLGLAQTRLPGRLEVLCEDPWIIVDGAHTRASARALARVLAGRPLNRGTLLLSVSQGKDLDAILQALLPFADEVVVTCAEPIRSFPAADLAATIRSRNPELPLQVVPDPGEAARAARESTGPGELLFAAGSIYLAAAAREVWSADPVGLNSNSR